MQQVRIFSEKKLDYIKNNWGKVTVHSMRNKLNCGADTVKKAAVSLGLEKPPTKPPNWTDADIEKLKRVS